MSRPKTSRVTTILAVASVGVLSSLTSTFTGLSDASDRFRPSRLLRRAIPVIGKHYDAKVSKIVERGAYLDLGLPILSGFLHISRAVPKGQSLESMEDAPFKEGDVVQVRPKSIGENAVEVLLPEADDFKIFHSSAPQEFYDAKVFKIVKDGAYFDLGLPSPGFLHISKVTPKDEFLKSMDDAPFKEGDVVKVRPCSIDKVKIQVLLPEAELFKDSEKLYDAKVVAIVEQGAYFDLGLPKHGFLHISKVTPGEGEDRFLESMEDAPFKVGDVVKVRIEHMRKGRAQVLLAGEGTSHEGASDD